MGLPHSSPDSTSLKRQFDSKPARKCGLFLFSDEDDLSHLLVFLLSTNFCEGLNFLSVRWGQPDQQHGRRIPSLSSETTLLTCSFLVSVVLTEIVQQIHSLRESGVISSQAANALASEDRAYRRSVGNGWAVPPGILFVVIRFGIIVSPSELFNARVFLRLFS